MTELEEQLRAIYPHWWDGAPYEWKKNPVEFWRGFAVGLSEKIVEGVTSGKFGEGLVLAIMFKSKISSEERILLLEYAARKIAELSDE